MNSDSTQIPDLLLFLWYRFKRQHYSEFMCTLCDCSSRWFRIIKYYMCFWIIMTMLLVFPCVLISRRCSSVVRFLDLINLGRAACDTTIRALLYFCYVFCVPEWPPSMWYYPELTVVWAELIVTCVLWHQVQFGSSKSAYWLDWSLEACKIYSDLFFSRRCKFSSLRCCCTEIDLDADELCGEMWFEFQETVCGWVSFFMVCVSRSGGWLNWFARVIIWFVYSKPL